MVNIINVCNDLNTEFSDNKSKQDVLMTCVSTKMTNLYLIQSERLDKIVDELTKCIDTDDYRHMGYVIKRLTSSLSSNRDKLLCSLERLCC